MESKFFLYSKTVQGIIILTIMIAKFAFDVELTQWDLEPLVDAVVTLAWVIMSLYGRFDAKTSLRFKK